MAAGQAVDAGPSEAARRERIAALRAQQKRAGRRRNLITFGAIGAVAAFIIGVVGAPCTGGLGTPLRK